METFHSKAGSVTRRWYLVDASGMVLGRLAAHLSRYLQGKHKAVYSPHVDVGDYIIVINAAQVRVTGRKLQDSFYHRHSGYPGGLRSTPLGEMLQRKPEFVIHNAVRGMLPKNRLGRAMAKKLKVYAADTHRHAAQSPEVLQI